MGSNNTPVVEYTIYVAGRTDVPAWIKVVVHENLNPLESYYCLACVLLCGFFAGRIRWISFCHYCWVRPTNDFLLWTVEEGEGSSPTTSDHCFSHLIDSISLLLGVSEYYSILQVVYTKLSLRIHTARFVSCIICPMIWTYNLFIILYKIVHFVYNCVPY